jgi:hypothetical protein
MGVSARGEIQTLGVARDVAVSGNAGEGAVGDVDKASTAGLSGVHVQGLVSQAIVPLNSQAIAAAVGSVEPVVSVALTGVGAVGAVRAMGVGPRLFALTGVRASGAVGSVIAVYWKPIDDTQVPDWQNVNNAQGVVWAEVDDTQVPDWTPVTT